MGFCNDHDHLYFDTICRTKKAESVLSLIHATYQTKLNNGSKKELAKKLEYAYELYKFDSGTYSGSTSQFESQYTIGHELGIWKNSDLELTELAIKVAQNKITIKEYFDIYFLNYIQPIDGKVYNLLILILDYMKKNNTKILTKDMIKQIFSFASKNQNNEINGLFNMLLGTSYFEKKDSMTLKCVYDLDNIYKCCNRYAHDKPYNEVNEEFRFLDKYLIYLLTDHRCIEITYSYIMNHKKIDDVLDLSYLLSSKNNKEFANRCFDVMEEYDLINQELLDKLCDPSYSNENCNTYSTKYSVLKRINRDISLDEQLKDDGHLRYYSDLRVYFGTDYAIMNNWYYGKQGLNNWTKFVQWIEELIKNKNHLESDLCGYNKIFYGIPGCGKSYHIEHEVLKEVSKDNIFRTTFYLDYTNSDFIGQIYPIVRDDNTVKYEPVPGPFTKALEKAYRNPNEMIYLVIEEINRGNAAAIFGDVFQLLDRIDESTIDKIGDGRVIGDSEYPVNIEFIDGYFTKVHKGASNGLGLQFNYQKGQKIIIPHNLTILATMNTSDQNVFPLDTAFKRRWDRERIVADWDKVDDELKNLYVPLTSITWETFAKQVNKKMIDNSDDGLIMEDKKIGPYFANKSMLVSKEKVKDNTKENKKKLQKFVNNIMDYLYNDVTKFEHTILFEDNLTYDDLYEKIEEYTKDWDYKNNKLCLTVFDDETIKKQSNNIEIEVNEDGNEED